MQAIQVIDEEKERAMKDPSFYIKAPSAEARDAMVWYGMVWYVMSKQLLQKYFHKCIR